MAPAQYTEEELKLKTQAAENELAKQRAEYMDWPDQYDKQGNPIAICPKCAQKIRRPSYWEAVKPGLNASNYWVIGANEHLTWNCACNYTLRTFPADS